MTIERFYLGELTWPDVEDFLTNHDVIVVACMHAEISETGVIGDPTKATREKGEQAWRIAIERLADLLTEPDRMELEL